MASSATDAATAAVERLRAARDQAKQRRAATKAAVEQLRERNREETRELSEQARLAKRRQNPPVWPETDREPQQMRLYDTDDAEHDAPPPLRQPVPPPRPVPPRPAAPPPAAPHRASDDDWSQESWLH